MKKIISVCALLAAGSAQAGFVYQTDRQFLTTGDLDGDGRADLVVVDASNATLRVGYQLSANTYTWANPRPLGLDSVAGVACGNVLSTNRAAVVATSPTLNRINIYEAPSATSALSPVPAYGSGIGPFSVAAMDVGGSGNTAHDDLAIASEMNGTSAFGLELVRSTGTGFSPLANFTYSSGWSQLNEVPYATGESALCAIYPGSWLCMYTATNGYFEAVDYGELSGIADPRYVAMTLPSGDAHFVVWQRGGTNAWTTTLEPDGSGGYAFSTLVAHPYSAPIDDIFVLQGASSNRLAIVTGGGTALELLDYDTYNGPTPILTLSPPAGETFLGILSAGLNDFVALSSAGGDAALTANPMHFSGGQFVSLGSQSLPSSAVSGMANVMTFENEPFVDSSPRRLQLLRAGDWSDSATLGATVSATAEDDSGPDYGLVNPHTVSLGAPASGAAYTLVNQLDAAISVQSLDAARGEEVVVVSVSPSPGEYGTSVSVSFTNTPATATVLYRTGGSDDWTTYSAPVPVFKDTDFEYYATYGGKASVIRTASYRFADSPSDLDSDGDGVPDYVELANGLDPVESGLDSDGDGFSDLEELLAGSDPLDDSDMPSSHLESGALFDQVLTPRPYDGAASATALCETGTQTRVYSAGGSLAGYAQTTNLSLSVATTNPAAFFSGQSMNANIPFFTALTDPRFDIQGAGTTNQLGVELAGIYLQPASTPIEVNYEYAGGTTAQESANWIAAAQSTYAALPRVVQVDDLGLDETLAALLVERKLADQLYSHGFSTNRWVSLFKGRTADTTMEGISVSGIQALETNSPAFGLREVVDNLKNQVPSLSNLRETARQVYAVCSDLGRDSSNAGKYPLPIDVLRSFIFDGTLHSNYLAQVSLTPAQLDAAAQEVGETLSAVPTRPWSSFTLAVRTNSFNGACPVLYNGGGMPKSLYTATGRPYRFPSTFQLGAGAEVQLTAYTDRDWNLCPGTDPLEVIALSLTALPAASPTDADGNLLPDDYEAMFLAGSGGTATSDLDGDGFGDLQEYLDGTDPSSPASHGATPVDLGAPVIELDGNNLSIGWPAAYADAFVFTVEYTGDLVGTPFAPEQELPEGNLDATLDQSADHRFYRVEMRLR